MLLCKALPPSLPSIPPTFTPLPSPPTLPPSLLHTLPPSHLPLGINIGAAGAVVSLFNELIHPYFKNRDHDQLYVGLTVQLAAIVALMITGIVLGATKAF